MRMNSVSAGGLFLGLGPDPVLFLARNVCVGGGGLSANEDLELLGLPRGGKGSASSEDISITLLGSTVHYSVRNQ